MHFVNIGAHVMLSSFQIQYSSAVAKICKIYTLWIRIICGICVKNQPRLFESLDVMMPIFPEICVKLTLFWRAEYLKKISPKSEIYGVPTHL